MVKISTAPATCQIGTKLWGQKDEGGLESPEVSDMAQAEGALELEEPDACLGK